MAGFHVVGLPDAMPVRNPNNGLVEDGYRFTVASNLTGARAVIEIPKSLFSPAKLDELATEEIGKLDAALGAFVKPAG